MGYIIKTYIPVEDESEIYPTREAAEEEVRNLESMNSGNIYEIWKKFGE